MRRITPTRAFTLIELLVVVTIIVVLLAMLAPALDKAITAAQRVHCLSNIHVLYSVQVTYAMDHKRKFAPNNSFTPDYQRTAANYPNDIVTLFRGTYIPSSKVVICPILAGMPNQWVNIYARNDWHTPTDPFGLYGSGDFGGWDSDAKLILTGYMWLANFRWYNGGPYDKPTMLNGEQDLPTNLADSSSARAFTTHRLDFNDSNGPEVEDCGHFGNGLHQPGAPYNQYQTSEQPVGYADGHEEVHTRDELKPRMTEGGVYPGGKTGYGVFVW